MRVAVPLTRSSKCFFKSRLAELAGQSSEEITGTCRPPHFGGGLMRDTAGSGLFHCRGCSEEETEWCRHIDTHAVGLGSFLFNVSGQEASGRG